jgi:type I restriction enzyme S subunit
MTQNKLPKNWKWEKFGEVVNNLDGKRRPLSRIIRAKRQGNFPYYGATDIVDYIDDFIFDGKYLLIGEDGANLVSKSRPLAFIAKGKFWVNNHAHIVQTKDFLEIDYLYHYFNSLTLSGYVTGTAQPKLNQANLNKIPIPLPPLKTQQLIVSKIEELFSELDKGIEDLKLTQQQLKTYRQSVLKYAFEGKLTNKKVKDGVLPKGWDFFSLKEVCEVKRGKSKNRPRNAPELYGGQYPFIQTGDIRNANGGYIKKYSQTYSEIGLAQSKLWPKGTLCITIAANIGETAILDFDACFPDSVVGLLSNEKTLFNKYLNYFFISFKQKLEELAPATAQKNINVDILEKVNIPLSPLEEQYKIVEEIESRLSVADKMEESITQSLQQAEALRQSILKKAFSGELV